MLDNLSAHKASETTKWLAHRDHRRWHLTNRLLRRGTFSKVPEVEHAIRPGLFTGTRTRKPFVCKAIAAEVIEDFRQGRAAL